MEAAVRTRRRPHEVRALLLSAAEKEFARKGYVHATTDDIAAAAGVTRSVMYRHFPSKSDLFREAVLTPFLGFLRDYRAVWEGQLDERWPAERVMRAMVSLLYDSMRSHRDAVIGLVSAQSALQPDVAAEVDRLFDEFFADMLVIGTDTATPVGWIPIDEDLELSVRMVLAMVTAAAVLDPIFLPKGRKRPTRDQIIDRLSALALYGLRLGPV
jgi:AcrR family transcriptional regulator